MLSASEPPPVVSVQDVSITYRTSFEKRPTLRDAVVRLGRGERSVREVEAVKKVSFDVPQGTVMGIVGSNGAGKSTLVRAIAGILPPTEGRIEVRGKVSTLLALGVGFNGSMSGQENVLLGGLAAGYTRQEIAQKYEEIADFAELGDFMEMPMKTYSSGMFSRLAFAVAVHMEPDILLVDEALSAGDAKFKEKAAAKMKSLVAEARTMFLVSHALGSVTELCNDAIWMNRGEIMMRGEPAAVVKEYTRFVKVGESAYTLEDM
ncbi:MAG TPA: ABC transporter ATP-binding protein [Candidatus Nanopelagicales bacterium]|nr:ABC transporter ATP-binding protein [Candidatus Nanopelagicales bacterium]